MPADSVAKKRTAGAKRKAEVSDVSVSSSQGSKPSKGGTGVELRFHKHQKFHDLPEDQKEELKEWNAKRRQGQASGRGGQAKSEMKSNKK